MTLQNSISVIVMILFITITIIFIIRYYKLLILAKGEYEKAKDIISIIILTFKRRLDKQDENINQLTIKTETTQFDLEVIKNSLHGIERKLITLIRPQTQKEVTNIDILKKEIEKVSENQQNLEKQFVALEEKILDINKETVTVIGSPSFSKVTETERLILQFLSNEGKRSAPEVEKKIGKTREHTARLMKKLWQEGYIERDTHRIPYTYHVTENFNKMEIKNLNTN